MILSPEQFTRLNELNVFAIKAQQYLEHECTIGGHNIVPLIDQIVIAPIFSKKDKQYIGEDRYSQLFKIGQVVLAVGVDLKVPIAESKVHIANAVAKHCAGECSSDFILPEYTGNFKKFISDVVQTVEKELCNNPIS